MIWYPVLRLLKVVVLEDYSSLFITTPSLYFLQVSVAYGNLVNESLSFRTSSTKVSSSPSIQQRRTGDINARFHMIYSRRSGRAVLLAFQTCRRTQLGVICP